MLGLLQNLFTKQKAVRQKRGQEREPLKKGLPVKVMLCLPIKDTMGGQSAKGVTQNWTCKVIDRSGDGFGVHIHNAASASPGDPCTLVFTYKKENIEVPGTVRHFAVFRDYARCGLNLKPTPQQAAIYDLMFEDAQTQQEPVAATVNSCLQRGGKPPKVRHRVIP